MGTVVSMLPPVTLYKELLNIFESEGDKVITNQSLLTDHKIVFWNLIMWFKVMKLPCFILDNDFTHNHVSAQVSWISKYLPDEKQMYRPSVQASATTRSSFGSKPRLDHEGLQKLEGATEGQSPKRKSSLSRIASGIGNFLKRSASKGKGGPSSVVSGSSAGAPNSLTGS